MGIRQRTEADIEPLARVLDRVSAAGDYPPHRPAPSERLIVTRDELVALVYDDDRAVAGHVALHEASAASVMDVATTALGVAAEHLSVVARLFVDPKHEHRGIGRALLDEAARRSLALGRRPVLDVWERLDRARAFYESAGWTAIGGATIAFRSSCTDACVHGGGSIRSIVYAYAGLKDR